MIKGYGDGRSFITKTEVLYYKKDSERRAEQVAGAIPGRLLLRPLKWRSVYDIILVVGKDRAAP